MQTKILPKFLKRSLTLFFVLLLISCTESSDCKDCNKCGENLEYGTSTQDSSITNISDVKMDTMVVADDQFIANKIKIEKKFGEQWDFCRCVIANDSLDQLIKNNTDLNDEFMRTFEEVDLKCKAFLVMSPNKTPDERMAHEKKIKKCLKVAGRR